MKEHEMSGSSPESDRPTTRQIGDRILQITYLPQADPTEVNERDSVDHEFIGKSDLHRLHAIVANNKRRLGPKSNKPQNPGR